MIMDNENNKFEDRNSKEAADRLKKLITSQKELEDSIADTAPKRKIAKESINAEKNDHPMDSETDKIEDRHPTGDPESTAGWFSDDLSQIELDQGNTGMNDIQAQNNLNSISNGESGEEISNFNDQEQTIASKPEEHPCTPPVMIHFQRCMSICMYVRID